MFRKNKLAMLVGEFLGTGLLTFTVLSALTVMGHGEITVPGGSLPINTPSTFFVAFSAGLLVLLMTLSLAGISGAIFNPAITVGLWTVRKLRSLQALSYIIVQVAGGAAAYGMYVYFTKQHVSTSSPFDGRVMVAEVLGTFVFAFGFAAAIYQRFSLAAKAATIGGSLMLGVIIASIGSKGYLNPAVAFGAHSWGWATYFLGPILGAIIGFNLYNLLFVETEIAEVAEAKSENGKLKAPLSHSVVAADIDARNRTADAKAKTAVVKKNMAESKIKPALKKPVAKKTAVKKPTNSRRRPNAV